MPPPVNDANRSYLPGSPERAELKARLAQMAGERIDIPLVIGGQRIRTGRLQQTVMPHDHRHVLADWHAADASHVQQAIDAALEARHEWASWSLAGPRGGVPARGGAAQHDLARDAERGDDARPVEDGLSGRDRCGVRADRLLAFQSVLTPSSSTGAADQYAGDVEPGRVPAARRRSSTRSRPFNFTSIAGNLPTAPALMGNTVVWKPASSAMLSAHYILELLEAAGLPPGVINFVPGDAAQISNVMLESPHLAGIHFTGSTAVFNGDVEDGR